MSAPAPDSGSGAADHHEQRRASLRPEPPQDGEFKVNPGEQPDGQTRVELEHRDIGRHDPGDGRNLPGRRRHGGWPAILQHEGSLPRPDPAHPQAPAPTTLWYGLSRSVTKRVRPVW